MIISPILDHVFRFRIILYLILLPEIPEKMIEERAGMLVNMSKIKYNPVLMDGKG